MSDDIGVDADRSREIPFPSAFPARLLFCQNADGAASLTKKTRIPSQIVELDPPISANTKMNELQAQLAEEAIQSKHDYSPMAWQRGRDPEFIRLFVGQRLQTKGPLHHGMDLSLGEIVRSQQQHDRTARPTVQGRVTIYWVQDIMQYQNATDATEYACDPLRRAEVDRADNVAMARSLRNERHAETRSHDNALYAFTNGSTCDGNGKKLAKERIFDYSEDKSYEDGGRVHCWGGYSEHLLIRPNGSYLFHSHSYSDGGNHTHHQHSWHGGKWCVATPKQNNIGAAEQELWLRHERKYSTWKGMGDIETRDEWKNANIKPLHVHGSMLEQEMGETNDDRAWLPHDCISMQGIKNLWSEPTREDAISYGTGTMKARVGP